MEGISFVTEREQDQVFYRKKWKGSTSFVGDDFRLLWAVFQKTCCQPIAINYIRQGKGCLLSSTDPYWSGTFNLTDLEFDVDAGEAKLGNSPSPDDGYQTLLENWDKEVNWMEIKALSPVFSGDRTILFRRGRLLVQMLAGLAGLCLKDTKAESLVPTVGTHTVSQFLEAPTNPVTRKANHLKGIAAHHASDVMAASAYPPNGPEPQYGFATQATTTLKKIVTDLQELFNLYPYIDSVTGKLRWEHESFFPALTYDAPSITYSLPTTRPEWKGKRTVKSDVVDLYGLYKLSIETNTSLTENFRPSAVSTNAITTAAGMNVGSITFTDPCVTRLPSEEPLTKTRTVTTFCTDLFPALALPDPPVDKENWIFLLLSSPSTGPASTVPQVPNGMVELRNEQITNGDLSAASLVRDFHRHNKPFAEGYTNIDPIIAPKGVRRSMRSVVPVRRLSEVTLSYCCTDTPVALNGHIETWLDKNGQLISADYNPATEQITLALAHPGPCQVPETDVPYTPDEPPITNCPPRGEWLREEFQYDYRPGESAEQGDAPCMISRAMFFTDGQCGEYSNGEILVNGGC